MRTNMEELSLLKKAWWEATEQFVMSGQNASPAIQKLLNAGDALAPYRPPNPPPADNGPFV